MTILAPIKAIILDMDGLMIDSESLYTVVTDEILKPYGKTLTWEIKSGLMGRPGPDAAQFLINATGIPLTPDQLMLEMEARLPLAFANVKPLPGIERLVKHCTRYGIPMAIATGSKHSNYLIKTAHLSSLFSPFGPHNLICGDDPILQGKGKPDPTIFLEAGKMLGRTTERERREVLVFEDGVPGVRAARAAGMEVIWVPDTELLKLMSKEPQDFMTSQTLSTLLEFKPEEWGLPAFEKV